MSFPAQRVKNKFGQTIDCECTALQSLEDGLLTHLNPFQEDGRPADVTLDAGRGVGGMLVLLLEV